MGLIRAIAFEADILRIDAKIEIAYPSLIKNNCQWRNGAIRRFHLYIGKYTEHTIIGLSFHFSCAPTGSFRPMRFTAAWFRITASWNLQILLKNPCPSTILMPKCFRIVILVAIVEKGIDFSTGWLSSHSQPLFYYKCQMAVNCFCKWKQQRRYLTIPAEAHQNVLRISSDQLTEISPLIIETNRPVLAILYLLIDHRWCQSSISRNTQIVSPLKFSGAVNCFYLLLDCLLKHEPG